VLDGVAVTSDGVGDRELKGYSDVVGLTDLVDVAVGDGEYVASDGEGEAQASAEGGVPAMEDL
jgi:hypothetical protein